MGENSLDRLGVVEALPRTSGKSALLDYRELPGGQVATAALAGARLGLRVAYVGSVGDDAAAEAVLEPLRRAAVDVSGVKRVAGTPTRRALILVERDSGERTVLWHRADALALRPEDLDRERIRSARALLLDAEDPDAASWAAGVAREAGVPVILDVDTLVPALRPLLARVDFPLVSRHVTECFWGEHSLREALGELAALGARLAVVTLGEFGALARCGERVIESPAFRVEARDTTGAGDAFHGAFAWALLEGAGADAALRAANAAGAISCRAAGAQGSLPSRAELERFLRENQPGPWREPGGTPKWVESG